MDLGTVNVVARHAVEAITLRKPMRKTPRLPEFDLTHGMIAPSEFGVSFAPSRTVRNFILTHLYTHFGFEIWQGVQPASGQDGERIRSVEAEEINSRLIGERDICAHVQFRKAGEPGQRRQATGVNVAHVEWGYRKPALALVGVKFQVARNQRTKHTHRNRPVREQQIMPGLCHNPRSGRQRPRPMRGEREGGVHGRGL